jgi:hypothetical protein
MSAAASTKEGEQIPFEGSPKTIEDLPEIKVYGEDFRKCILAMHQTITKYKAWDKVKKGPSDPSHGFMWSLDKWQKEIEEDPLCMTAVHSGATLALCWRYCEQIATIGLIEFVKMYTKK